MQCFFTVLGITICRTVIQYLRKILTQILYKKNLPPKKIHQIFVIVW